VPEESVNAFFDDDARFQIHANLSTERGAIFDRAMEEARDALFQSGNKNVTWADALEELCLRSLGTIKSATRSDRYRVVVHVNEHGGWLNAGPRLPDGALKDILSNPIIQPLFERNGRPIALGRSARVVPYRLAELIRDRDRTCRNPACHTTRGLEVHHIIHWADGGTTNPKNLGCLCRRCHRQHHAGKFGITGNAELPGGLTFTKPNGDIIEPCGKPNPPDALPRSAKPYQHPIGEAFNQHDLTFNPPPSDTPRVTPQPLRQPAPKLWEQQRVTPAAADPYIPTDEDIARYAQKRDQVITDSLRHQYLSLQRDGYDNTQLASYNKLFATATT
jgi:HNH endonuclease